MEDHKIVQRNLALQREWYGEPLGDRVRRLVVACSSFKSAKLASSVSAEKRRMATWACTPSHGQPAAACIE